MSLSDRFIRNPVLTTVCSLVILLIGGVAIPLLPLEKLPQLAPTQIQVTAADSKIGGTQVYLDPSESFTAEEMIYAMMIQSANDLFNEAYSEIRGFSDFFQFN